MKRNKYIGLQINTYKVCYIKPETCITLVYSSLHNEDDLKMVVLLQLKQK